MLLESDPESEEVEEDYADLILDFTVALCRQSKASLVVAGGKAEGCGDSAEQRGDVVLKGVVAVAIGKGRGALR